MLFGPQLKSIGCADKRQIPHPERTAAKKGWIRLLIGLMISPNQQQTYIRNYR